MLAFRPHMHKVSGIAFTPDGRHLVTSSTDETVRIWNLETLVEERRFPGSAYEAPIAISPNGRFLARCGGEFHVWELESGREVVADEDRHPDSVAFSPDGGEVALFGHDEPLARWALPNGQPLDGGWGGSRRENDGERFPAGALACSPDGKVIVTPYGVRSEEGVGAHLLLWSRKTGRARLEIATDFGAFLPFALSYSPDGDTIVGIYGPVLGVVDAKTGGKVAAIRPGRKFFNGFAFTPDGARLIAVNNDAAVRVFDAATWIETTGYEWKIGKLTAVAVAPDGLRAACGSASGRVVVWDLDN